MNLHERVIAWAEERGMLERTPERIEAQILKVFDEIGETAKAILFQDRAKIIDGFGDVAVTLIVLGALLEHKTTIIEKVTINYKLNFINVTSNIAHPRLALTLLSAYMLQLGYDYNGCLLFAYAQIKDRTGKMINNNYVKDEDKNT